MIKTIFKIFVPRNSLVFKLAFKVYDYRFWYPKKWKFAVLKTYAKLRPNISFIQIGSNDGITGDPIFPFIANNQWKGLVVEPVPYLFERLKLNYQPYGHRVVFENSAISNENGELPFYRLSQSDDISLPIWYDQLGSFSKIVVERHKSAIPNFDRLFVEDKVNAMTFDTMISKHAINKAELIHIDTEGYDYEILKAIPFSRLGVELVMFEHVHLSDTDYRSALKLFKKNNFHCERLDSDTVAVRKGFLKDLIDHAEIA